MVRPIWDAIFTSWYRIQACPLRLSRYTSHILQNGQRPPNLNDIEDKTAIHNGDFGFFGTENMKETLREYDVVRVVALKTQQRHCTGSAGVVRSPAVGDIATICHEYAPQDKTAPVAVEYIASDGRTIWLADFEREELELMERPQGER